jgi:hypothetical protein
MAFIPTADLIAKPNLNYVWDPNTMSWVKETQPGGGSGGGTSSTFGAAFPATGTAVGFKDVSGNMAAGNLDAGGNLKVTGGGGGPVTIVDGGNVVEGTTTDAAVTGDNSGTISAKLRGLLKVLDGTAASGTLTNIADTLVINTRGMGSLSIWQPTVSGGWDGTIVMEATNDGTNWFPVKVARQDDGQIITQFSNTGFVIRVNVAGFEQYRLRVSARTQGSTTLTMYTSDNMYQSYLAASIFDQTTGNHLTIDGFGASKTLLVNAAGGNMIGGPVAGAASYPVVIASDQPAVPTSVANGSNVTEGNTADVAVQGDNPGTISAKLRGLNKSIAAGITTAPPANASTNVAQFGGTNVSTGTGAGGAGIPRVTVSNDSVVGLAAGTQVIGHVIVDSGSITANAGTNLNTSALALDATLTGGLAKSIVRGGQKGATNTNADITHTASGADHEALDVILRDGSTSTPLGTAGNSLVTSANITGGSVGISGNVSVQQAGTWLIGVKDNATGNAITVEGPNIPAAAGDNSLVVGLSPNSPLPTGMNQIGHVVVDSIPKGGDVDLATLVAIFQGTLIDLLKDIRTELRVLNTVGQVGLNVKDDLDILRNDPTYLN